MNKINYIRLLAFFVISQLLVFYLNFLAYGELLVYSESLAWGAGFLAFFGIGSSILLDLEAKADFKPPTNIEDYDLP